MTIESDAFEKLNARIEILRQGSAARVQWNARIPDPDDPTQERQIDVLIDKNGVLTGVECRLRSAAQSVMWIEELIGRKQSLGLNGMIGIAVEGFTELALKKAKRYGIILYDYRHLSDAEIASWTNAATVEAVYVQFDPLVILAGVSQANANRLQANPVFKYQNKDGHLYQPFDLSGSERSSLDLA